MTLHIAIPEDLDTASVRQLDREVREFVAVQLYRQGKLSHGKLAKFLGIGRGEADGHGYHKCRPIGPRNFLAIVARWPDGHGYQKCWPVGPLTAAADGGPAGSPRYVWLRREVWGASAGLSHMSR